MKPTLKTLLAAALIVGAANADASATASDDWFVRIGLHAVDPTSDNGTLAGGALTADIGSDARPTIVLGRSFGEHWAVELLASTPFKHSVSLNGTEALEFKHLPPTLTLQYYLAPQATVNPFVGVGLNYTLTFDEQERGPLSGTRTRVGNSFGPAAQVGLVVDTGRSWQLIADLRWADIDADISVDGADVGSVSVDPLVYGVYLGWRF